MKPSIIIVAPSGSGKSTSLRNLDADKTVILNTERKALPFRGANKFGDKNISIKNPSEYKKILEYSLGKPSEEVTTIVTDSFTSYAEMVYLDATNMFNGFDVWAHYKEELLKTFQKAKDTDKYVVFTAIDQVIEGVGGVEERFVAVDGSWKKKVEKEFVICVYVEARTNDKGEMEHVFITNKQPGYENISAKSPAGMLPPIMPNDLALLIKYSEEYYNGDDASWQENKND